MPNRTVMNNPTTRGMAAPSWATPVSMASFIHEKVQPQMTVINQQGEDAVRATGRHGQSGPRNTQLPQTPTSLR